MFSLGFRQSDYSFYSVSKGLSTELDYGSNLEFAFQISVDKVIHSRAIYSVWDFLGDVGGLFDMLKIIAEPIVALSTAMLGSGLDRYLVQALFRKESRRRPSESVFTHIKRRKHTKVKWCNWLYDRRNRNLHK